jgi:hypothetical protein
MIHIALTAALVLISASVAPAWPAKAQMPSPYAGEQGREIKALSTKDIDDLTQGRGMGSPRLPNSTDIPAPCMASNWPSRSSCRTSNGRR